ncbi:phytoene/squalene synthase family protein [Paenibacillus pasadenensis]|uniref:phytoene/squalene synthase family protein n=1 Tax=Paenibacillus pasadenensis TaxID=217090 RepID=UPI00203B0D1B|nr:phytoene/squalene synthase family protein [Paenibacillus pasadenensis]MCM3747737.1 phytoene/squalene synthase family protein [Paenibacillus pasadenensis]
MLEARLAAQCEAVMKQSSASFYEAFRLLSSPRREAVFVIYAFCRMIDDSVDEPERAFYTLEELEERFDRLEEADGHFIWPALRWLLDSFPLGKEPFRTQMGGQRMDRYRTHYRSLEELEDYCYRVAGSVGEMLLPVLHEQPDAVITEAGVWLGKAMQIVNILRDAGEDRELGRRYIPLQLMERYGYSEHDFDAGLVDEAFAGMAEELAALADDWFRRGLQGIRTYPADSEFAVRLAAAYYGAIVDAARSNGWDVFTKRAYVTGDARRLLLRNVMLDMASEQTREAGSAEEKDRTQRAQRDHGERSLPEDPAKRMAL